MITLANRVRTLLGSAGAPVWYFYPQSWIQLPVISWRESGNREFAQADGGEHLAGELHARRERPDVVAAGIDAAMASARLRRDYSADLFEPSTGCHHRSARYRCVADAAGNIYQ